MKSRIIILVLIWFILAGSNVYSQADPGRFDSFLGTQWYSCYVQNDKMGYAELLFEKVESPMPGWRIRESTTMIFNTFGKIDTMKSVDEYFYLYPGGELYSSDSRNSSSDANMHIKGVRENDKYVVTIRLGGRETKKVFDYPVDYLDNYKFPNLKIASGQVVVGDSLNSSYFDHNPPITGMIHYNMKIESVDEYDFAGVPTEVYTIGFEIPELKFKGTSVFDKAGRELETNMGVMRFKLEEKEQALKINSENDLMAHYLIKPRKKLKNPTQLFSVTLRITGIGKEDIINTGSQNVTAKSKDDFLVVIKKAHEPANPADLPIRSSKLAKYLAPTEFIQSDDELISTLAADLVRDETDSWEAAKKINQWIYNNIEKEFTTEITNALQTLRSGKGDCEGHSILAVALMRAAGIPARPVTGLVYWPPGEAFGYHAWVEAFVGQWVMMDPLMGENLVNPTHIALVRGDIVDQASVLTRVIGRVGIEVSDAW